MHSYARIHKGIELDCSGMHSLALCACVLVSAHSLLERLERGFHQSIKLLMYDLRLMW